MLDWKKPRKEESHEEKRKKIEALLDSEEIEYERLENNSKHPKLCWKVEEELTIQPHPVRYGVEVVGDKDEFKNRVEEILKRDCSPIELKEKTPPSQTDHYFKNCSYCGTAYDVEWEKVEPEEETSYEIKYRKCPECEKLFFDSQIGLIPKGFRQSSGEEEVSSNLTKKQEEALEFCREELQKADRELTKAELVNRLESSGIFYHRHQAKKTLKFFIRNDDIPLESSGYKVRGRDDEY